MHLTNYISVVAKNENFGFVMNTKFSSPPFISESPCINALVRMEVYTGYLMNENDGMSRKTIYLMSIQTSKKYTKHMNIVIRKLRAS